MSNDRVASFYDLGIISSLIESTHICAGNIGEVNSTAHSTFIRTDDHHTLAVHMNIIYIRKQCFDKLVGRLNGLKTFQRNRVLYTRIMCIKSDNIIDAHIGQFLKRKSTV